MSRNRNLGRGRSLRFGSIRFQGHRGVTKFVGIVACHFGRLMNRRENISRDTLGFSVANYRFTDFADSDARFGEIAANKCMYIC